MGFKCIYCNGVEFEPIAQELRDSKSYKVVKCCNCGIVQLDKIPDVSEDQEYYDKDKQMKSIIPDFSIEKLRENAIPDLERRYNYILEIEKKMHKIETILEIGCGYGFFVDYLSKRDYDIEGIEISAERREIANSICKNKIRDTNLLINTTEDSVQEISEKMYDLICMFQVLEHISEPNQFLEKIKNRYMKESSLLLIEVPNLSDNMLRVSKEYNDFYWQRAHLVYYDVNTLKMVLKNAGYVIVDAFTNQRYSIENAFNWMIEGTPQFDKPSFELEGPLNWLENYYKKTLKENLSADTLVIIARKSDV
ncbi:class I SAM-dependent methyltransferase [Eubacteriaceae bacterium ES3]|nr:class I SAM-dependent methyltransferase [Eubacteriaceae bacterium ES3]